MCFVHSIHMFHCRSHTNQSQCALCALDTHAQLWLCRFWLPPRLPKNRRAACTQHTQFDSKVLHFYFIQSSCPFRNPTVLGFIVFSCIHQKSMCFTHSTHNPTASDFISFSYTQHTHFKCGVSHYWIHILIQSRMLYALDTSTHTVSCCFTYSSKSTCFMYSQTMSCFIAIRIPIESQCALYTLDTHTQTSSTVSLLMSHIPSVLHSVLRQAAHHCHLVLHCRLLGSCASTRLEFIIDMRLCLIHLLSILLSSIFTLRFTLACIKFCYAALHASMYQILLVPTAPFVSVFCSASRCSPYFAAIVTVPTRSLLLDIILLCPLVLKLLRLAFRPYWPLSLTCAHSTLSRPFADSLHAFLNVSQPSWPRRNDVQSQLPYAHTPCTDCTSSSPLTLKCRYAIGLLHIRCHGVTLPLAVHFEFGGKHRLYMTITLLSSIAPTKSECVTRSILNQLQTQPLILISLVIPCASYHAHSILCNSTLTIASRISTRSLTPTGSLHMASFWGPSPNPGAFCVP